MKKILRSTIASVVICFLANPAHAEVWRNTIGDGSWNTAGNWFNPASVPVGTSTAIWNSTSPGGTITLSANGTCARIRLNNNTPNHTIVIHSNALANVSLTMTGGAAELFDFVASTSGRSLTFSGATNENGFALSMVINGATANCPVNGGASLILNCNVSGVNGFTMNAGNVGAGTIVLGGNNSFSGAVTINAGTVRLGHPYGLGFGGITSGVAIPGTTVSATGATLDVNGQTSVNEIITLNGTGISGAGALINSSGTPASIAGGALHSISLTSGGSQYSYPTTVSITGGGGTGAAATAHLGLTPASFTLTSGGAQYTSNPTVTISGGGGTGATATAQADTDPGSGTYQQVTNITLVNPGRGFTSAPTVTFNHALGLGASVDVNVTNFTVAAVSVTAAGSGYTSPPSISFSDGLDGTGAAGTANMAAVTLATDSTVGGSGSLAIDAVVSGASVLTKTGAGVLTLNAANLYSGGTVINQGTLLVNNTSGSGTGPGAVTVNGGALGGSGTVAGAVTVNGGGSIAAGASAGILSLGDGLNLSTGGTNVWELAALKDDGDGVAGTDFDQVTLTAGELDLSGDSQLLLKFSGSASAPYSTNTFWQANHSWTLVSLSGSAANSTNLPFANIVNGNYNAGWFSNYVGTGGEIVLVYTTNPPSAPVISAQPQDFTTNWGKPASFSVAASGSDPLEYQWYFQNAGNPIGGATDSAYSLPAVQPADQGDYFAIITNSYGAKTSEVATLTVVITPAPTIQPLVGAGTPNVMISWDSVVGGTYQLLYNTNLAETNWYLITNLVATGASVTVTDFPPVNAPERYYRVQGQ